MAKKKEEPIADNETGSIKVKEKKQSKPEGDKTDGDVTKVKEKMTSKAVDLDAETITKVDLNKTAEDTTVEPDVDTVKIEESVVENPPPLEDVTVEGGEQEVTIEETAEVVADAIKENIETQKPLPSSVQKVVDFMEETGGDLNDYVKLNQDYDKLDNDDLLHEYYKQTKPHLNNEEINFLMEDTFSYDEEQDEDRDIRRKKLALKEQVASAKAHLEENKSKYYEEIKAGSKLTKEQQGAIDYFNTHSKEARQTQEYEEKAKSTFLNKTNRFFGDKFKGFEYNVGDKKYRFNVNDVDKVKDTQSDINNFIGKFLDENRQMSDEAGYHKSLFTAMNSDTIANHFYEQGKADALKQSVSESKNINMDPRQELSGNISNDGVKVRVLGDTTADFKFKIKNKK